MTEYKHIAKYRYTLHKDAATQHLYLIIKPKICFSLKKSCWLKSFDKIIFYAMDKLIYMKTKLFVHC